MGADQRSHIGSDDICISVQRHAPAAIFRGVVPLSCLKVKRRERSSAQHVGSDCVHFGAAPRSCGECAWSCGARARALTDLTSSCLKVKRLRAVQSTSSMSCPARCSPRKHVRQSIVGVQFIDGMLIDPNAPTALEKCLRASERPTTEAVNCKLQVATDIVCRQRKTHHGIRVVEQRSKSETPMASQPEETRRNHCLVVRPQQVRGRSKATQISIPDLVVYASCGPRSHEQELTPEIHLYHQEIQDIDKMHTFHDT